MGREVITSITIKAPASKVWSILTDFAEYPQWNPFLKSLEITSEGKELKEGSRLKVTMKLPGDSPMTFKPKVLVAEKGRELRWLGVTGMKGIFDGEHRFVLEEADGQTILTHGERFTGIFVGVFMSLKGKKVVEAFKSVNTALKERAEVQV
mmetsp:Transcript_3900/g.4497  ORF Transcript_3900/g.4497 Transcript_3900/m.4497 type:complete len:151 (-) Transcript_3900:1148-1600(-)